MVEQLFMRGEIETEKGDRDIGDLNERCLTPPRLSTSLRYAQDERFLSLFVLRSFDRLRFRPKSKKVLTFFDLLLNLPYA